MRWQDFTPSQRVAARMALVGMAKKDLAALIGVAHTAIATTLRSLDDTRSYVRLYTAIAISDALGVTLDWLVFGDDPMLKSEKAGTSAEIPAHLPLLMMTHQRIRPVRTEKPRPDRATQASSTASGRKPPRPQ